MSLFHHKAEVSHIEADIGDSVLREKKLPPITIENIKFLTTANIEKLVGPEFKDGLKLIDEAIALYLTKRQLASNDEDKNSLKDSFGSRVFNRTKAILVSYLLAALSFRAVKIEQERLTRIGIDSKVKYGFIKSQSGVYLLRSFLEVQTIKRNGTVSHFLAEFSERHSPLNIRIDPFFIKDNFARGIFTENQNRITLAQNSISSNQEYLKNRPVVVIHESLHANTRMLLSKNKPFAFYGAVTGNAIVPEYRRNILAEYGKGFSFDEVNSYFNEIRIYALELKRDFIDNSTEYDFRLIREKIACFGYSFHYTMSFAVSVLALSRGIQASLNDADERDEVLKHIRYSYYGSGAKRYMLEKLPVEIGYNNEVSPLFVYIPLVKLHRGASQQERLDILNEQLKLLEEGCLRVIRESKKYMKVVIQVQKTMRLAESSNTKEKDRM